MFRDGIELRSEDNVNMVLAHCALGDGIATLPAIRWARAMHDQDMTIHVFAPPHMIPLFEYLIGTPGLKFLPMSLFNENHKRGTTDKTIAGATVVNGVYRNHITRNRMDLVAFGYMTLLDRQPDNMEELEYPQQPLIGEKPLDVPYVAIPVGATNDLGAMPGHVLKPIVDWCVEHDLKPVLFSAKSTHVHTMEKGKPILLKIRDRADEIGPDTLAKCLDMRFKTNDLLVYRDWLGYAQAVVGIDGGSLHLAGTTNVPIVYGCTRVDPRHRPIVRFGEMNWNLVHITPRDLECAGCQSNWTLLFHHNFATCMYGDNKCVSALHGKDFTDALEILEAQIV